MLDYFYLLETREELKPSNEIFNELLINVQYESLGKREKDWRRRIYEEELREEKEHLTRINFDSYENIEEVKNEVVCYPKNDNSKNNLDSTCAFFRKRKKLKID